MLPKESGILRQEACLEGRAEPVSLECELPAYRRVTEIGAAPCLFAGGIDLDMPLRGAHEPDELALGGCRPAGEAGALGYGAYPRHLPPRPG